MISTRNLTALPPIPKLKLLTQSLAMLDAIIEREWEYRYYSFNCQWASGQQMASMRNGQGDGWFLGFSAEGAFLKGFDHESAMSPWGLETSKVWPGVLDGIPKELNTFATEPAFSMDDTTFCIWRTAQDVQWRTGEISYPAIDDPDGSEWMLSICDGNPETYKTWAEGYYECPVSLLAVQRIYEQQPLARELARELNPTIESESLSAEAQEIGYPVARV